MKCEGALWVIVIFSFCLFVFVISHISFFFIKPVILTWVFCKSSERSWLWRAFHVLDDVCVHMQMCMCVHTLWIPKGARRWCRTLCNWSHRCFSETQYERLLWTQLHKRIKPSQPLSSHYTCHKLPNKHFLPNRLVSNFSTFV